MTDYFGKLCSSGNPAADVQRFYRDAGRLDTLAHVTRVAAEARVLATRHSADQEATLLAALSHDLAAVVPESAMIAVAEGLGILVSGANRTILLLLHGPIAAAVLSKTLGVCDEDVLNAVRYHSTLRAGAGTLEKIVFLADKIAYDPTSPHGGEYLPALRAARTLEDAALVYLDFLLDNSWRYGWLLHPDAVAAYRDLTGRTRA